MTTPDISTLTPEQCEQLKSSPNTNFGTSLRTLALACGIALSANHALSQTTPVSPADSAIAAAAKGLEYGQYSSNGDSFEEFLQKYGNKSIDEAEKLVDTKKWTEKDFDKFVKYQDTKDIKAVVSLDEGIKNGKQAVVSKTAEGTELDKELIKTKLITLEYFIKLTQSGNTNSSEYTKLKGDFKKIILSNKPLEIINRIRAIPGLETQILSA